MGLFNRNLQIKKNNYIYIYEFNIYFFLLIVNFLAYSIYAVLSKYNILFIEILINLNFIIFFYFYKKNLTDRISFNIKLNNAEIIFFLVLLVSLIFLTFSELTIPLFIDELATTRRATRTAFFASFLLLNFLDLEYLKTIPLKFTIQFLNILQIFFVIGILYLFKKKTNLLNLIFILLITFFLRLIIKDGVHHPPLNHIFSTTFISFFGLNHIVVRMSYLIPFWIFLISLFKLVRNSLNEKTSMTFILSVATFPFLLIASTSPDHSIWSCIIFTYLLFYVFLKKNIDYRFCILIISIGILFRLSVFSAFLLIGLCFIGDYLNKKFLLIDKIIFLIKDQKIPLIFLIFLPIFFVSLEGTPAFEGTDSLNLFHYFFEAIRSKVIIYTLIKQIPPWYYLFIIFLLFFNRKIEILCFFVFNLIIYFSISPYLWGSGKYVLEYGVPFFLIGHFIFTKLLIDKKKILLAYILNFIIIFFNIYDVYKFPKSNISLDLMYDAGFKSPEFNKSIHKNTKYMLKFPYSYDKAFDYISKQNARRNTLMLGTTYGFLPQILENYSYDELIDVINLRNNFDKIFETNYSLSKKITKIDESKKLKKMLIEYLNLMKKNNIVRANNNYKKSEISQAQIEIEGFSKLNEINNLKYLLLANYGNRKNIKKILLSNNWTVEKEFHEKNYRSTLILFKKN